MSDSAMTRKPCKWAGCIHRLIAPTCLTLSIPIWEWESFVPEIDCGRLKILPRRCRVGRRKTSNRLWNSRSRLDVVREDWLRLRVQLLHNYAALPALATTLVAQRCRRYLIEICRHMVSTLLHPSPINSQPPW